MKRNAIKIILLALICSFMTWDMWYDFRQDKVFEFYNSHPIVILVPLAIAICLGILIHFFAIYLSPPKKCIAGFIGWGIGNLYFLYVSVILGWFLVKTFAGLDYSIHDGVFCEILLYLLFIISGTIVSFYFLIKRYRESFSSSIHLKSLNSPISHTIISTAKDTKE